jgi:hypothetical protein
MELIWIKIPTGSRDIMSGAINLKYLVANYISLSYMTYFNLHLKPAAEIS